MTSPGPLARFLSSGPSRPSLPGGNTPWARRYGDEIKDLINRQASHAPRSKQAHIGPSEIGIECHYQVVGKMAAAPSTNHVPSPWPAIIGTAVHAWLARAFEDENTRTGMERFLTELAVAPVPEHAGTTDLYDRFWNATVDHKVLGPTSLAKIARNIPPRRYLVQLLLYWLGCLNAGLPAERIVLIAYPRAAATLDGMYIWEHVPGPEDTALLAEVLRITAIRRQIAGEILAGRMTLSQVPITPSDEECFWCPFFRPQSARDMGPGCPGTSIGQGSL